MSQKFSNFAPCQGDVPVKKMRLKMGDATKLAMFNGIHMIHGASGFRVTLGILFSDKAT
jgi:hypothetical protein